jgi:mono/diheme cytochrome c family protein
MTLLASTLLVIGIAAGPGPGKTSGRPRAFEELPKAPVEIVLPAAESKPEAQAKPVSRPRIVISAPSLSKPPAPMTPPTPPPAAAPTAEAAPAATGSAQKGAEVVASTSSAALPLEQQPGYQLIVQKCGRCHGVEKALNAQLSPDDWDAYLKKKFRRNGAGISPQQAEEIHAFLRSWSARAGQR